MRTPILSLALVAAGCQATADAPVAESGADYYVLGELPEGADADELAEDLPPGGFGVVADPASGSVATFVSVSSPLARDANGEFSLAGAATCVDCGDPTCASFTRTIRVPLENTGGNGTDTYEITEASSTNFTVTVPPADFTLAVGNTIDIDTTGTLGACATFGHFFNVEGPDTLGLTESLIFSEYVEGSSSNKAVEIANIGTASIDLSRCDIELYSNGINPGPSSSATLASTTLAPGDAYVVCRDDIADAVVDDGLAFTGCDQFENGVINFNGDDGLVLRCDGNIMDSFGQLGVDPGSEWIGGGQNDTLRRICGTEGDTNFEDAFDAAATWTAHAQDDVTDLGTYVCP